mgnify:CR=1 FL=1|jgi:hypothetical protein
MPIYDCVCGACGAIREIITMKIDPGTIKTSDCECGENDWKRIISVSRSKGRDIDGETRQTEDMCDARWT